MKIVFALLACFFCVQNLRAQTTNSVGPGEGRTVHFSGGLPRAAQNPNEPAFDLSEESFQVFVPKNYSGKERFGLFVFIDSQNEMMFPKEWEALMERNRLIGLIPQRIGNDQPTARRLGLAQVGILKMVEGYKIDPKRIFISGFSGGARCALHLAFLRSDLITGSISICGADFYEPVPQVKAVDTKKYGVWPMADRLATAAKMDVRFVFITGDKDFRHGNILDIYEGGFVKNHFQADLIDLPGMGHQLCKPEALQQAIDFVDQKHKSSP